MQRLANKLIVLIAGLVVILVSTLAFAHSDQTAQGLRIQAVQYLIDQGFDRFQTIPFGPGSDHIHLSGSTTTPDFPSYYLTTGIDAQDDLDALLEKKISEYTLQHPLYSRVSSLSLEDIALTDTDIKQLKKVYLFKNQQDLEDLGYVVSSYRTRINNDAQWRMDNIYRSYLNIGNIRVLNTQENFAFMDEVHKDTSIKPRSLGFAAGYGIAGGVVKMAGGGICGAARGINATILPNRAFEIITRYNHTRTFRNMYQNEINGKEFWIPGIDVAVYRMDAGTKDFVFKNIREYPVILVMNFDGKRGSQEEGFVLSHVEDRGTIEYKGNNGHCYNWEANGVPFKSCYNAVNGW